MNDKLTHLNDKGEANMVNVGDKDVSKRHASARAYVEMQSTTLAMIDQGQHKKGDVFSVARIAGIQAAKKCADLIPLCHPLNLTHISVELCCNAKKNRVEIVSSCELDAKTGVEMEALTAASVAALTVYDMCKAVDKTMCVQGLQVIEKTGGKSGDWTLE